MQAELDGEVHMKPIDILGVNLAGLGNNEAFCSGKTIPWLQDTADAMVWASWGAAWRDVFVLDGELKPVAIYNLSANNLGDPAKYAELKAIITGAADQ